MSKMDAQRAMREAKYARLQAVSAPTRKGAQVPVAPPPTRSAATPAVAASAAEATGTCGHKSMNGRTCTRDAGHSEKSHRYS